MSLNVLETILEQGRGGVWHLPSQKEPRALQKLAREHGYAFFHIDGKSISRKDQLLNHMANAMRFPKEFGHNWDALEDHLTDLEWVDAEGYVIYYDHIDKLLEAQPDQFETLVEILRDAVASWKEDGTAMVALLAGPRAPKGVAKLGSKEELD
jgi:RNAse (barnase) inhibitor barstar